MMNLRAVFIALPILVACGGCASGQTLFSDDFQDGDTAGWGGDPGRGDVRLTQYAGNTSMRLTRNAAAQTVISVGGYENIRASVSFAAQGLEGDDACLLEVSLDGEAWREIGRIADGEDDSVTLHSVTGAVPEATGRARLALRLRADANANNDTCWADNVSVTGRISPERLSGHFSPEQLMGALPVTEFVATTAFAAPADALPPSNRFEGRLAFDVQSADTHMSVFEDRFEFLGIANTLNDVIPSFDFEFVQSGDRLIPAARGLQPSRHPFWEYVLAPGYLWDEPDDNGWTRAALPFAIVEKNANCVHNGLLSFMFRTGGEVSRIRYQIGSETCLYFKFDAWGSAAASFTPGDVSNADELVASFEREMAARMPTRAISTLAEAYPGIEPTAFGNPEDVAPESMSAFGLVADGIHYVSGCETRYGAYPYCDELILPSYSVAKSIFAGIGLMRLERLYPGAMDALVTDYVPECAAAGGWDGVTFEHALDMTTGRYISTESEADENAAIEARFFITETHAEKIELACTRYPRRTAPGERWVYHTTDTYILGTAMRAFWRERNGPDADFYEGLLYGPVFSRLGLSPTLSATRRTYDDVAQPFTGWGLVLQRSDIARLVHFLSVEDGVIDGEALLSQTELQSALQRNDADPGLPAPTEMFRYNNGFWAWNFGAFEGCSEPVWVPFMSGFGGISVVFLPGGATYYYFSDGGDYRWARAVRESERIQPFCTR